MEINKKSASRQGVSDFAEGLPLFARQLVAQEETLPSPPKLAQPKHWTVSELTQQIRAVVEPAFIQVWVMGEVSNYRPAASGHAYFSLKDQNATLSAAAFSWGARKRPFVLKDGLLVLCRGKVTIYPPRGGYQLIVEHLEPLGSGALQIAFEQLKAKLAGEGLFDPQLKRPLPRFPLRIAVVTSPSGAAIQDILNILKRRAPHIQVTVVPAIVQGDDAAAQIVRGIEMANRFLLGDVIIVGRGGGSIEDLACFNNEALARAIRASALPIVSAVGHEIDFTISDFVADLRAPTPSAAAEIVSGYWVDAVHRIQDASLRIRAAMIRNLSHRKTLLSHISARVVSPKDRLREQAQKTDDLALRLNVAIMSRIERKKNLLAQSSGKLDALSPLRVLERGYTLVKDTETPGRVVKSAKQVKSGQELEVTFYDGQRIVRAI